MGCWREYQTIAQVALYDTVHLANLDKSCTLNAASAKYLVGIHGGGVLVSRACSLIQHTLTRQMGAVHEVKTMVGLSCADKWGCTRL